MHALDYCLVMCSLFSLLMIYAFMTGCQITPNVSSTTSFLTAGKVFFEIVEMFLLSLVYHVYIYDNQQTLLNQSYVQQCFFVCLYLLCISYKITSHRQCILNSEPFVTASFQFHSLFLGLQLLYDTIYIYIILFCSLHGVICVMYIDSSRCYITCSKT